MSHTGYDDSQSRLPMHVTGYYANGVRPDFYDMSVFYAAGALYPSVGDGTKHWHDTHVSQQSLDAIFASHIPCPPHGCALSPDLGYGWFARR